MKFELISVIVPVYNVEKYLDRCVESIVNQTYTNLEIILVDDGSPDNCSAMCDAWAEKDNRIKVIHKENGGLSSARNSGLDVMTGEYVYFIDSDDTIEKNTLELLYFAIVNNDVEISMAGFNLVYISDKSVLKIKKHQFSKTGIISCKECLENFYSPYGFVMSCNKLYHSSLFEKKRFRNGILYEDADLLFDFYIILDNIYYCDCSTYNYYIRSDSITNQLFNQKQLVIIDIMKKQLDLLCEKNYKTAYYNCLRVFCQRLKAAYLNSKRDSNIRDENKYRILLIKYIAKCLVMKIHLPIKFILFNLAFVISPIIYYKVRKNENVSMV